MDTVFQKSLVNDILRPISRALIRYLRAAALARIAEARREYPMAADSELSRWHSSAD